MEEKFEVIDLRDIDEPIFRGFKGIWIPKEIWFAKDINFQEKLLWAEIDSLDTKKGCIASNKYFAKFFNLSETQISMYVSSLRKKEYIWEEGFNGRQRILHSNLKLVKGRLKENLKADLKKTLINNKDNNLLLTVSKPRRDLQIISLFIKEIGLKPDNKDQFNQIVRRNLRPAQKLIGYSNEDIKETIQVLRHTDYLKRFTLETVTKYIDEVVAQKQKRGPKIIRFEEIKKSDGEITVRPIYEKE